MLLALTLSLMTSTGGKLLLEPGDQAPPFSMRELSRSMFSLEDHVGPAPTTPKKAMVMAFFATWCGPCKQEIPIMKSLLSRWSGKGVGVMYVGFAQGAKDLEPFAKEQQLPWPVVPDAFGLLSRRYGASQLPHLVIVDSAGKIAFQHVGIAPDLAQLLDRELSRITGEAVTPASPPLATPRFSRELRFGRVPASTQSASRWQPLAAFVGEAVSARVEVASDDSYATFEAALRRGQYEVANAGPLLCHDVRELYEPVARIERQGQPTYQGIVFSLRQSGIEMLSQLRGKRVGLVAERSTSGGLFPLIALREAGLDPGTDVTVVYLGDHEAVARAVRDGKVDAGGCYEDCRDGVWPDEAKKNSATQVLGYTAPIPGDFVLVRKNLEPRLKEQLARAFLSLNDQAAILGQISQGDLSITAISAASSADLAAIEAALARAGKSP